MAPEVRAARQLSLLMDVGKRAMNLFFCFKGRSWKSTGVALVTILGLLCWFAPALLVHSPLWPRILGQLTKDMDAQLQTGSVSLGWLSPIVVHDLVLLDAQGDAVVTVETLRVERSLWSLIWDQKQLGTIRIEQPQVSLVFHQSGSNLEQLLAPLLETPSSSPPPQGQVEILAGRVHMADAVTGDKTALSEIEARLQLPGAAAKDGWRFELKRCIVASRSVQGSCQLDCALAWARRVDIADGLDHGGDSARRSAGAARIAQPLIRRFVPEMQITGLLSGSVHGQWDSVTRNAVANVDQLAINSFELVAPAWIGQDHLRVRELSVQGKCRLAGNQVQLEGVKIQSDFAHADATGLWTFPALQDQQAGTLRWEDLLQGEFSIDGRVDIARLAATLPHTMLHARGHDNRIRTDACDGRMSAARRRAPLDGAADDQ